MNTKTTTARDDRKSTINANDVAFKRSMSESQYRDTQRRDWEKANRK